VSSNSGWIRFMSIGTTTTPTSQRLLLLRLPPAWPDRRPPRAARLSGGHRSASASAVRATNGHRDVCRSESGGSRRSRRTPGSTASPGQAQEGCRKTATRPCPAKRPLPK